MRWIMLLALVLIFTGTVKVSWVEPHLWCAVDMRAPHSIMSQLKSIVRDHDACRGRK